MSSQTLPSDPSVTISFDGLIMMVYNRERRLCQAGIHTQAPGHKLQIEVRKKGEDAPVWPTADSTWDGTHEHVKAVAPLWLYVDSGDGLRDADFSAELYKPEELDDPQSFGHVLDFEGQLYERQLEFLPDPIAVLNVAQGVFYSGSNEEFVLESLAEGQQDVNQGSFEGDITASSLVAAAVDARSGQGVKRSIVLEQENPEREVLFRFELEEGASFEITVKNVPPEFEMGDMPMGDQMPGMSPEEHFLQYYKLFVLEKGEKRFFVRPVVENPEVITQDSPPCNVGRGSLSSTLP